MKFQTPKNDPINRDDEDRLEIKNDIIATWLGVSLSTGTGWLTISLSLARG